MTRNSIRRTFSDMLQMMVMDWKNCVLTECSLRITTNKARLSYRFSNWIIGLQMTAITLYSCGVLAVNAGDVQRMNVSAREHILKMKLPFKVNTFPVYTLVTIFEFFHLAMCGWAISVINSLIITLVSLRHYSASKNGIIVLYYYSRVLDLRYCTSAVKSIYFATGC